MIVNAKRQSFRPGATLLRITEVAQFFRKGVETIGRWRRIGIWVGDGKDRRRVKLRCLKSGGTWLVPPAAVDQFLAETNTARRSEPAAKQHDPAQTPGYKAAMKSLAANGYVNV